MRNLYTISLIQFTVFAAWVESSLSKKRKKLEKNAEYSLTRTLFFGQNLLEIDLKWATTLFYRQKSTDRI